MRLEHPAVREVGSAENKQKPHKDGKTKGHGSQLKELPGVKARSFQQQHKQSSNRLAPNVQNKHLRVLMDIRR